MADPLISASQDVVMRPPESPAASTSASDPASSLRAAALLTLKLRRKAQADPAISTLPSRPPPGEPALQLDYGQEESTSTPREASPPPTVEPPESQAREEGEISDEEATQPTAARPILRAPTPPPPGRQRHPTPSTSAVPHIERSHPKPKLSERISDPPTGPGFATIEQATMSDYMQPNPPHLQGSRYLPNADHVRPGVALNQSQYDRAKDVVLDLLGWGVAPEYLVDCGLTREIVYYVFNELNLRLPQNLDTTGLVPFTPDVPLSIERQKSALMPPPPPPQARRYSQGQSSVPSNPSAQTLSLAPTPIAIAPPASSLASSIKPPASLISESPKPAITGNLHDMEQQRRQELLARKAAIASRKSKQTPIASTSSTPPVSLVPSSFASSIDKDVEMAVPTETVDDFLKSIGSSATPIKAVDSSPVSTSCGPPKTVDDMDIDEIPGLGGARHYEAIASFPSSGSFHPPLSADALISPTQSSHAPMSPNECPPSSTESTSTTFTQTSGSYTPSDTLGLPEGPTLQRRGAKRPVAADFVDFDAGSRPPSNGHGPYTNGMQSSSRRRIGAGFASVTSARRFIIDLSDSEGEDDTDVVMRDVGQKETVTRRSVYASPVPTRPSVPNLNTSSGWATPPVSTPTPTLSTAVITMSGTMSPAALLEKEIEIQKMRELIAEREQRRQNKFAAMKANAEASASTEPVSMTVKREETPMILTTDSDSNVQNGSMQKDFAQSQRHIESVSASVQLSDSSSSNASASATPKIGSQFSRLLALPTPG
ncbi:hypothetical protein D9615_002894 [Tricholomella constricta]|uniref:Uncharacterized protein n=1 Tax=Tricholomella constricta TaxID=117010 RepID=A0A8H5M6K8_9AGAR|nr:hypothetical protein D9615_002894 [Tricholomella constricta]